MKIAIVTGVWQRPEIFELWATGIKHLVNNSKHNDYVIIVAGSEGRKSKMMVEAHGFIYIEYENQPLARKMNATLQAAKRHRPDYVLCIGSDDIITPELMLVYGHHMNRGIDYIGILDWYFLDFKTGRASYWGGYIDSRVGHTCGAGRLISNRLMEKMKWEMWDVRHSNILDDSLQQKLRAIPHSAVTFKLKDHNVYALDIKGNVNMTPFELWKNTKYIDNKVIYQKFDYLNLCAV